MKEWKNPKRRTTPPNAIKTQRWDEAESLKNLAFLA